MFARGEGQGRTRGYTPAMAPPDEQTEPVEPTDDVLVEDELLVEEISIDGMCGVY